MHMTKPTRALFLLAVVSSTTVVACGVAIKRDLGTIPQGQVGFDDMCGLQDYFDSLEAKVANEPQLVNALDLEGGDGVTTVRGGKARYEFKGNFQLKHGRRVLDENWRRLPEELTTAESFDVEVRWAEKAGVKRVVTDQPAELFIGKDSWSLPYHVCLSEWIFGAPLYKQRRVLFGLPDPTPKIDFGGPIGHDGDAGAPPPATAPAPAPDAGAAPDAK
jgi:hypothetical protein